MCPPDGGLRMVVVYAIQGRIALPEILKLAFLLCVAQLTRTRGSHHNIKSRIVYGF